MIAKQVPMRSSRRSNFAELVRYITDSQGNSERVGLVSITNCHSTDPISAGIEVQANQQLNRRSKADKTYHLIVSFRAGENPSDDVLAAIEKRICAAIGFEEHQRVSAAHYDTENVHLHIAISKVHPIKRTVHTPFNDHWHLARACERLEAEFGLQADNHLAQKIGSENRAQDMERHSGVESFLGWLKRECLPELETANSWHELHSALSRNGAELRLRGNGFVISDSSGLEVKASSVSRSLSKQQLEKRFGAFDSSMDPLGNSGGSGASPASSIDGEQFAPAALPSPQDLEDQVAYRSEPVGGAWLADGDHRNPPPSVSAEGRAEKQRQLVGGGDAEHIRGGRNEARRRLGSELLPFPVDGAARKEYRKQVAQTYLDTSALYAQYRAEQSHARQMRTGESAALRGRQKAEEEALWASNAAHRSALKHLGVDPLAKRVLYALAKRALKANLAELREKHRRERVLLTRRTWRLQWVDWLQLKAVAGQENALEVLRARAFRDDLFRDAASRSSIAASGRPTGAPLGLPIAAVTKKGTLLFQAGTTAIRDDGACLQVSKEADLGGIHLALRIAERRYGNRLTVNGSPEFKARVVASAAAQRLQVTFVDKDLERRHQALLTLRNGMPNGRKDRSGVVGGSNGAGELRGAGRNSGKPRGQPSRDTGAAGEQRRSTVAGNERGDGSGRFGERSLSASSNAAFVKSSADARPIVAAPSRRAGGTSSGGKPNVGSIAGEPPAFRKNRVRDLSELGVVLFEGSGPVLLPGDVPGHVDESPAESSAVVRRPVPRGRVIVGGSEAAAKFIAERSEKLALCFDIPNMKTYTTGPERAFKFAGLRTIDGVSLALLTMEGTVEVLPVDAQAAQRLKRVRVGNEITVTEHGTVKTKGRSR
jgi:hypothetical protein